MATRTEQRAPASQMEPAWHVIDAEGKTLGRLSSEIAVLLQGKHKPTFVPYLNTGDFVIVVNAEKIHVTGNKLRQKMYYRHSGYHGGLREQTLFDVLKRTPTRVIRLSVKGMLPKSKLGRRMLSRLKLYTGGSHPHEAQVNARPKPPVEETQSEPAPKAAPTRARAKEKASAVTELAAEPAPVTEAPEPSEETPPKARRSRATSTSPTKTAESTEEEPAAEAVATKPRAAGKPKRARGAAEAGAESVSGEASGESVAEAPETEPTPKRKPSRPRASAKTRSKAGSDENPPESAPAKEEA